MSLSYHESFLKDLARHDTIFLEKEYPKLVQAAEVHGYRGPSKKRHNGVVPIRPTDTNLLKQLTKLVKEHNITDKFSPIKVVAHVPSGNRLIGVKYENGDIMILGVACY